MRKSKTPTAPFKKRPPYEIDDLYELLAAITRDYLPLGIYRVATWAATPMGRKRSSGWGVVITAAASTAPLQAAAVLADIKRRLAAYEVRMYQFVDMGVCVIRIYGEWSWAIT